MTPSRKKKVFAGAVAALSLVVALIGAELGARGVSATYRRMHDPPRPFFVQHPTRGWALKPGYDSDEVWGFRFRVNGLGFRGPEVEREKGPATYRVLLLGDSIVMGAALPEAVLVSSQLEKMLAESWPERRSEVLNAGVGGYGIKEEKDLLLSDGLALAPDAVVLVSCLNDVPGVEITDLVNPLRDLPVPGKKWLTAHSALALVIQDLYNRIGLKSGAPPAWLAPERDPATVERLDRGWKQFGADLKIMADASRARGIKFMVLLVPHAAQFEDPGRRFLPQQRLAALCAELNLPFLDLAPAFASQSRLPYILPDPVHPSPQGHQLMAERIAAALK
jgi:lysophospholipase L1-like esterase